MTLDTDREPDGHMKDTKRRTCKICGVQDIPRGVDWRWWDAGQTAHYTCAVLLGTDVHMAEHSSDGAQPESKMPESSLKIHVSGDTFTITFHETEWRAPNWQSITRSEAIDLSVMLTVAINGNQKVSHSYGNAITHTHGDLDAQDSSVHDEIMRGIRKLQFLVMNIQRERDVHRSMNVNLARKTVDYRSMLEALLDARNDPGKRNDMENWDVLWEATKRALV